MQDREDMLFYVNLVLNKLEYVKLDENIKFGRYICFKCTPYIYQYGFCYETKEGFCPIDKSKLHFINGWTYFKILISEHKNISFINDIDILISLKSYFKFLGDIYTDESEIIKGYDFTKDIKLIIEFFFSEFPIEMIL